MSDSLLTYIGLRINNEKVSQVFQDNNGKYHFWTGIKYLRIGHQYKSEDNKMKIIPEDLGLNDTLTEEQLTEFSAKELAAMQFQRRKRASKKVSGLSFKNKNLLELNSIYKKLSYDEKDRFVEAIKRTIIFGDK